MDFIFNSLGVNPHDGFLALAAIEFLFILFLILHIRTLRIQLMSQPVERQTYVPGSLIAEAERPVELQKTDDDSGVQAKEDGDKKKYDFVDPAFDRAPIVPTERMIGREEGKNGDAIYGNENKYERDDYIGRVSHGAELELLDRRVYMNEFELDIIKVRVLKNEWSSEIGRIGWVGLDDTSFRSTFDAERREVG